MPDPAHEAAVELVQFVKELVKPWVDFRGHEENFAAIIRKHFKPEDPWRGHESAEEFSERFWKDKE